MHGEWSDGYWWSSDGLRLHYRDYAGDASRPPILCIPGLTRNARDFEGVADRLAGDWRLICVELRGRGESAYAKDPMTYVPLTYLQDLEALIAELELDRFVLFGTSLGGLITMLLAMSDTRRIAGALLNDIGPAFETRGLDHIRSYVGKPAELADLAPRRPLPARGAARPLSRLEPRRLAGLRQAALQADARRTGRVRLRHAHRRAVPAAAAARAASTCGAPLPASTGIPSLVLRGELSDLLSPETVARMVDENPAMEAAEVPRVGHAPTLDEPEAAAAIDRLLARVTAS